MLLPLSCLYAIYYATADTVPEVVSTRSGGVEISVASDRQWSWRSGTHERDMSWILQESGFDASAALLPTSTLEAVS